MYTANRTRTVRVGSVVSSANANPTQSRPDAYGSLESGTEPDSSMIPRVAAEANSRFGNGDLTRFNKIATQGAPQMAVDKEANSLSRVYSYYSKFNLCLFYV